MMIPFRRDIDPPYIHPIAIEGQMTSTPRIPAPPVPQGTSRHARRTLGVLALVALASALSWALIEPFTLSVERATITSHAVPADFDGVRIAFVSDVHSGPFFGPSRTARLIDEVNALQPDLVILGGDYVGGHGDGAEIFYPLAARLDAPLGTIAVLGNHESWEGIEKARSGLSEAGITLLENENVLVEQGGSGIFVAGVEDLQTGRPDAGRAAAGVVPGGYGILVSHNPDVLADALPQVGPAFDLALAGHVHGGQVTLFGERAVWVPSAYGERYRQGWREESGVPVLVSRGVGTVHLPFRFFAGPQIHVIELRRGAPAFASSD